MTAQQYKRCGHTSRTSYVGPRSTSIIVRWKSQRKYWFEFNKAIAHRTVALVDAHKLALGNLAWEIGAEIGQTQNEGRHHPKGRLAGDQRLRKDRSPLADGFPSCAAKAAVSRADEHENTCSQRRQDHNAIRAVLGTSRRRYGSGDCFRSPCRPSMKVCGVDRSRNAMLITP